MLVHFFFPSQEKKKETAETQSFKSHPVLIALAEGRLPDEKPNYEYFAQILALDDQVTVKPKRSWIFVSHRDFNVSEDGSGHNPATSELLSRDEYPHLARNLERDSWPKDEQQIVKGTILHDFTKTLQQGESCSVKEVSDEWESLFPELHQRVEAVAANDTRCEFLHMHVTLEMQGRKRFPSQSELNSWIDISVEQPHLHNHRWKVQTRLARPPELCDSDPDTLYETTAEIEQHHRPGCVEARRNPDGTNRRAADCATQCRRETVSVPFPAPVWARTFSNCAEYPAHRLAGPEPTQMDLMGQTAMLQEIWSCPPEGPHDSHLFGAEASQGAGVSPRWARRAMILWTFETVHSFSDKGELLTADHGKTSWRFLTALDPTSQVHQQQALLSGAAAAEVFGGRRSRADSHTPSTDGVALPRPTVMSPSPSYQQQFHASMSENFGSAWDTGMGAMSAASAGAYVSHHTPLGHPSAGSGGGLSVLDGFGPESSLATPPPTASLSGSFSQSFHESSHGDLGYLSVNTSSVGVDTEHTLGSLAAVTDPFLAGATGGSLGVDMYGSQGQDYGHGQDHLSAWDAHGLDASGWSAGYANAGSAQQSGLEWTLHQGMPKTTVAGQDWVGTTGVTTGPEDRDLWASATAGAVTPNATPTPDITDHGYTHPGAARGDHESHSQENQPWLLPGVSASIPNPSELSRDWGESMLSRTRSHKRKPSDTNFSLMKHLDASTHAHAQKRTRRESEDDRENYAATRIEHHALGQGGGGSDMHGAVPVANMDGHHINIKDEWA